MMPAVERRTVATCRSALCKSPFSALGKSFGSSLAKSLVSFPCSTFGRSLGLPPSTVIHLRRPHTFGGARLGWTGRTGLLALHDLGREIRAGLRHEPRTELVTQRARLDLFDRAIRQSGRSVAEHVILKPQLTIAFVNTREDEIEQQLELARHEMVEIMLSFAAPVNEAGIAEQGQMMAHGGLALFEQLACRGQVWMTATEASLFEGIREASRFHVEGGTVIPR